MIFRVTCRSPLPAPVVTFDTDQTYVPAERSGRTADRRRLGLRMFRVELRAQN